MGTACGVRYSWNGERRGRETYENKPVCTAAYVAWMRRIKEYNEWGTWYPSGLSAPMSSVIAVHRPTHVRLAAPRCLWHCSFWAPDASAVALMCLAVG